VRPFKEVCAALIQEEDGLFLIAQRKPEDKFGGLWEFPGGAREAGESYETCLKREMKEELGIEVEVGKELSTFEDEIPTLKICVHLFQCRIQEGRPSPLDCQDVQWADLSGLSKVPLAPVDQTIFEWLRAHLPLKKYP
jgi:A/G-specific adenine glycosylase